MKSLKIGQIILEQNMIKRIQECIDDAIYLEDHFTQNYNNEVLLLLYKLDELLEPLLDHHENNIGFSLN